jgi:hypothetical protein
MEMYVIKITRGLWLQSIRRDSAFLTEHLHLAKTWARRAYAQRELSKFSEGSGLLTELRDRGRIMGWNVQLAIEPVDVYVMPRTFDV